VIKVRSCWKASFWLLVLVTLWLSLAPVDQIPSGLNFWDKAQHTLGFVALGFLGLMGYPGQVTRIMLGLAMFGVGIECAQWISGWRQGDWMDWLADCIGLLLGLAAWRLAHLLRKLAP
jgi:VanZ family protein